MKNCAYEGTQRSDSRLTEAPDILVVDDTPANLRLLSSILKEEGHKVRPAPSGSLALSAARSSTPDLILLDINMPEMNGYEVCQALKADEDLADVPVIFLSALSETEDKLKAFEAGGVDYITKPFQYEEVRARVETHLRIRRLQVELEDKIDRLGEAEELRESLVHMIVHDLRSPLTGVMASLQIMEMNWNQSDEQGFEDLHRALDSSRAMSSMINSLLDVAKIEAGELELNPEETSLSDAADDAVRALGGLAREVTLEIERPDPPVTISVDRALITRVIGNFLGNAIKFTRSGGRIDVRFVHLPAGGRIEVADTGMGVPEEYREKIFEKFGQVEARENRARSSTGLGLAFCKLVVEAHGGRVGVDSEVGSGSTFWIDLPKMPGGSLDGGKIG